MVRAGLARASDHVYEALGARPLDETSVFRLTGDALARLAASAARQPDA
jgi:hypothetical protein